MEDKVRQAICERENDLVTFLYGEADEHDAQDFERHLQSCSACKGELSSFQNIRQSVGAWRQESLTAAPAYSVRSNLSAVPGSFRSVDVRKPSAVAAIRAFFELSPLWTKGALALTAVLFCVVSIFAAMLFFKSRQPHLVTNDKVYNEEELKAKVEQGVVAKLEALRAGKDDVAPAPLAATVNTQPEPPKITQGGAKPGSDHPVAQRRPLSRSEREQLAADLRLISPKDETDLDLVDDKINN